MRILNRILVATDFSPASKPAVAQAIRLAKESGAELTIAHAYKPPTPMAFEGYLAPPGLYEEWEEALQTASEASLRPLIENAEKEGVKARALILRGIPYLEIAEAARANGADLVVIGTHGRTGLPRFFLGSVAERIISTAPCPVMTVRSF